MPRALIPDRKSFLLLAGFWLALLPLYGLWLWCDQVTAPWDMSIHARLAFDLWQGLRHGHFGRIYTLSTYYPPLFHLLAAPLTLISSHPDIYCAANWLALFALIWAVWLTGRAMGGAAAGLAAGALVPAFIFVSWMCRMALVDLVQTAAVAWTLWLLVRGAALGEGRQAHALGVCLGLGLLAKWPYAFFTALPLAVYLWLAFAGEEGGWRMRKNRRALGWLIFWPLALAGPWYAHALPALLGALPYRLSRDFGRTHGSPELFSCASLTRYARWLAGDYLRGPLLILLALGLIVLLVELAQKNGPARKMMRGWTLLGLSALSGYAIMTAIAIKEPRYIMSVVPVLAVVSTHWVGRFGRRTQVAAVSVIFVFSFTMVAWNLFRLLPPNPADMKVEALAEWIVAQRGAGAKKIQTLVIPNDWKLNATALDYALHRRRQRCNARYAGKPLTEKVLKSYRYVLIADPPDPPSNTSPCAVLNTQFMTGRRDWQPCASFTCGDGRVLKLLERIPRARR